MKKHLVVLTGAGISAESGLKTFRDSDGLWENHRIEDVATPEAFARNPKLILDFYNMRRKAAAEAEPNIAHLTLAQMETDFRVTLITQNVDDLHERAGSSRVLHLHGELSKVRSTENSHLIYDIGEKEINLGDMAEDGAQLRPHIVWFGEAVPLIAQAVDIVSEADILMIIGTSLQVYPAAGLIDCARFDIPVFVVDKHIPSLPGGRNFQLYEESASMALPKIAKNLKG